MNNNTQTENDELVIFAGGVEIEVEYLDGTRDKVKVRQLPLRRLADYGAAQGDEGALCELFCNKEQPWADNLTLESAVRIVTIGDKLNLDPFVQWSQRRMATNKHLAPLIQEAITDSAKFARPSAPGAGTSPTK